MKLGDAIVAAGVFGRVSSRNFGDLAVGIHTHAEFTNGKPTLWLFDMGEPIRMLSEREATRFLTNDFTDWRPSN